MSFKQIATGVFCFFMGLMLLVTVVAFTKKYSGVTGMDVTQIQQMRNQTVKAEEE